MAGADDLRPLDAAIDEIRILREAAEHAAGRIGDESRRLTEGGSPTGALAADLAEALVERTAAIREDCERLDALLHRARAALAATTRAPATRAPLADVAPSLAEPLPAIAAEPYPVEPRYTEAPRYPQQPEQPDPFEPEYAQPAPVAPPAESGPSWRFWRRGRGGESSRSGEAPARLPRADYEAKGVGPVTRLEDPGARSPNPVPEGVRLVATQMAISGSSRIEVERRLQRQFGITDADAALNEIFGAGSSTPFG